MEAAGNKFIRIHAFSLFFLSLLHLLTFSFAAADIPLGSSLSSSNPSQAWSSPNNTFSLRFLPVNSSTYSLAITYGSIPIWKAGGDSALVGSGAWFQLLPSGDLRLLSSSGTVLWSSNTSNRGVSHATLDDSGNFMLKNGSGIVWSTFDHPTDTIVSSLNFTSGMILTSGSYSFSLKRTGNLTLTWNKSVVYYNSGVNSSVNANLTNPHLSLRSTGVLALYDPNFSGPIIIAYSSDYGDTGDIFRFLKLDDDGNLRIYSFSSSKGSNTPTVRWAAVSDQCMVFGYCGNMGICSYNDSSPICGCPSQNFEPIDTSDSRKGCKWKKALSDCLQSQTMLQLDHTRFLTHPPQTNSELFFEGISACNGNCLSGTSCLTSTSLGDGSGQCYMTGPSDFVSGYHSVAFLSTSFVKVCEPSLPNPPSSSEETRKGEGWVIALAILGALLCFILVEGSLWWWCCRKSPNFGGMSVQYALLEYASGAPVQFSYKQLQRATKGFKEKLGEGGFGAVYKGVLANRTFVAVKQLEGIEQGEKQFRMEVATISSTHHLNLVRLMGFCSEGRHRLLVYEFMKNGSLDSFLFASEETESGKRLSWEQRFNVALGTARGITYLHQECRDCIVHCDIKPENILLDSNYNAKVSDFGLAKLINQKDQRYRTLASVRGTRGYLAPEWIANLPITSKSDVYSYGMVLLEIVSGRRNFEVSAETNWKKFSSWAYEEFDKGNVKSVIGKRLADYEVDMDQVTRAIQVSFWCIQEQPSQRPMMGKVVQMLEGIVEIEKPPAPKAAPEGGPMTTRGGGLDISTPSTLPASSSGPDTRSSLSLETPRYLSSGSRMNMGSPASSLIQGPANLSY